LASSAGDKRVHVDYDRLMQSPDPELNQMAKYFDLEIDLTELQNYKTEFFDQGLRHTVYDLSDLLLDDICPSAENLATGSVEFVCYPEIELKQAHV